MNHYKVGYKAVIEIDKVFEQDGEKLYRAKGMKSLVFDGKGLDKLKPLSAYTETLKKEAEENYRMGANAEYEKWKEHSSRIRAEGQNEAWELARKCMLMTDREREMIFGSGHNALYGVLTYFDYKHAASKVAEWEKAKEEPQKTILQDFLEKYPKARMDDDGIPFNICTYNLGYEDDKCECDLKCEKCWNTPLEQI